MSIKSYISLVVPFLKKERIAVIGLLFIFVIADTVLDFFNSDIIIFALIAVYMFGIKFYKISSHLTFLFCFFLLLIMFIYLLIDNSGISEKAAVWFFFFMAIGIIQQLKYE